MLKFNKKNRCFIKKSYFFQILLNLLSLVIKHNSNVFYFFKTVKVVTYFNFYFTINVFKNILLMTINDNFLMQMWNENKQRFQEFKEC